MTIGLQRTKVNTWEGIIPSLSTSIQVAHGFGFTPDAAEVNVKAKTGTDIGGATITVTTDATNITVSVDSGPMLAAWVFEINYVEAL